MDVACDGVHTLYKAQEWVMLHSAVNEGTTLSGP